jgi:hypothetical protein
MPGLYANDGSYRVTIAGSDTVPSAQLGNVSGTITSGGAAQTLSAANANRRGAYILNLSSGDLWVSDVGTAAATQPSVRIPAGSLYEFPYAPAAAISIFGATTGQAFSARVW